MLVFVLLARFPIDNKELLLHRKEKIHFAIGLHTINTCLTKSGRLDEPAIVTLQRWVTKPLETPAFEQILERTLHLREDIIDADLFPFRVIDLRKHLRFAATMGNILCIFKETIRIYSILCECETPEQNADDVVGNCADFERDGC